MKVFDISDKRNPKYVAAVETACGSHTHTLVPERKNVYVYVSSYSPERRPSRTASRRTTASPSSRCRARRPRQAAVVGLPGALPGRTAATPARRPTRASPRPPAATTSPCCPSKDLAAGACMGDGILFDIKDPEHPKVIDRVQDNVNFAFWHSATFNQTADKVVFTDELGGGGAATCNDGDRPEPRRRRHLRHRRQGRPAQARLPQLLQDPPPPGRHRELRRPQRLADPGQGPRHHGPGLVPGRRLRLGLHRLRQARRRSPTSSAARSATTARRRGGSWSAYYYNGYIYSNDIAKGFDVLKLDDRRTDPAKQVRLRRAQRPDPAGLLRPVPLVLAPVPGPARERAPT